MQKSYARVHFSFNLCLGLLRPFNVHYKIINNYLRTVMFSKRLPAMSTFRTWLLDYLRDVCRKRVERLCTTSSDKQVSLLLSDNNGRNVVKPQVRLFLSLWNDKQLCAMLFYNI